jgi:hypothetical protein
LQAIEILLLMKILNQFAMSRMIILILFFIAIPFLGYANGFVYASTGGQQVPVAAAQAPAPEQRVQLVVKDGTIKLTHSGTMDVVVYNIHGNVVATATDSNGAFEFKPKQSGIYLVRANNKTYKVVVR